jgi:carbon-monoxide dehydrogenase catalytic subunit
MLKKAQNDGVDTAFDRAAAMKPCPIGADSACCKHCAMGPCRLNSKDPYSKVGVCGATIDTIHSRNFAIFEGFGIGWKSPETRELY